MTHTTLYGASKVRRGVAAVAVVDVVVVLTHRIQVMGRHSGCFLEGKE